MLAKTGLLIVTNPKHIGKILGVVGREVKNTLYIQLLSSLSTPISFHPKSFISWPKYSQTIWGIYSQAAQYCQGLDVRVLLSGLKYTNISTIQTQREIELVIFDKTHSQVDIEAFVTSKIGNISKECGVMTIDNELDSQVPSVSNSENEKIYKHSVLGGTFDRLHMAHKVLLSEASLRSVNKVTVGVTEENMLRSKTLWELIEPTDVRLNTVQHFVKDICPELEVCVIPISDIYGPTQVDATMEMLVLSAETVQGGEKINAIRKSKNMPLLDILAVELISEPFRMEYEEEKISSSTSRMRLLGTLLKPVEENSLIPKKPYIIGLTGGIASGKSGVSKHLKNLGAHVIDSDKIGHEIYLPGKPCYDAVVQHFGQQVVAENGEINRKVLGSIVFSDSEQLKKLNSLVWPSMAEVVKQQISQTESEVVVVEAAILLTAGWDKHCHEVWVTMIPPEEAVKRLQSRNSLTKEQAENRISSQNDNRTYVNAAHVVFCSLWHYDYTCTQVDRAWSLLKERL